MSIDLEHGIAIVLVALLLIFGLLVVSVQLWMMSTETNVLRPGVQRTVQVEMRVGRHNEGPS
jgi:hypothetical protein